MRIHQIINHFGLDRGGAERLARLLHSGLLEAGHDAWLVGLEECSTADLRNAVSLKGRGAYDWRILPRLAAYARSEIKRGDLVHAHLFPSSAYISVLARLDMLRASCIFTEHNTSNGRRHRLWGRALDRAVYGTYDRVVAISEGVEDALIDAYPKLAGRTEIILNGCDLMFDAPPERENADCLTILSVARLEPQKNYRVALQAMAGLKGFRFRYVVLGNGTDRAALIDLAQGLGLTERVEFMGHQSDPKQYFLDADIFLMPSLWEGFGLAAVEAMNASLPIVASDVAGLREVVGATADCALLVDPNSVQSVREAIEELLKSRKLRAQMGRRGFERSRRFNKNQMVDSYRRLYLNCRKPLLAD